MAEVKPWERQPGESAKAYEAFSLYRDMGVERSLSKVGNALGKSKTMMDKWSSPNAFNWVERAKAWDIEQDRILQKQQIEDIKKMRKRHASVAVSMLVKAAEALKKLPLEEIKAADISRMVDTASKLERISRGDVGDVIEERDGGTSIDPVQIYVPDNQRGRENRSFDDLEL